MCDSHATPARSGGLARCSLLKASAAAPALWALGGSLYGSLAFAASLTQAQRDAMTPASVIELMKRGNLRFRKGEKQPRDVLAEQRSSAKGQYPAAVILSSIRARRPSASSISASATSSMPAWPATSPTTTPSAAWNSPASWPAPRWCW